MPTDDIAPAVAAEEGPRHAVPRKTLLQRLHMPVGKAIALAAMPSAALMGMGFTSPLAKADPQPENPFRGESCVSVEDGEPGGEGPEQGADAPEPGEDGEPAGEDAQGAAEEPAEDAAEPGPGAGGSDREEAAGAAGGDAGGGDPGGPSGGERERPAESAGAAGPAGEPAAGQEPGEPEPSAREPGAAGEPEGGEDGPEPEEAGAEREFDPWDPLGLGRGLGDLGKGLGDLLAPGRRDEDRPPEEPTAPRPPRDPEEPPVAPVAPPAPGDDGGEGDGGGGAEEDPGQREPAPGEADGEADTGPEDGSDTAPDDPDDPDDEAAPDEQGTEEEAGEETEGEAGAETEGDGGGEAADDPFAPDAQGREAFPCPVEQSVPGTAEQTPVTLPNDPWYLEASYLTLAGLRYHGVVNVTTQDGTTKQVLKFTAEKVDIGDLHQIVDMGGGVRTHVATAAGSNSTFRDGTVTMYTERLQGKLFGVIPIVFDPEHQPPLDLPLVHFTDVFVTQAGQFGGTLTMRGMSLYHTEDGPTVPPPA
ncbi:hypothetical protein [Streptomyces marincola]|uniref:Hydrogenase expression protein HypF n=1 Tax=Streptomyces marincola TaxID=2878388 RepID=A0A1W7CUG2_9ACTN|nr:hypothetical protein [Streptomyces marincola]ARQ68392.1 hypothetical protein CAG99_05595 [Streptomyces marincola]